MKLTLSEVKPTLLLALPIAIGQLGHVLTGVADYTMLGHHDSLEMAGTTFATSVFFPIMILGLGMSIGLTPLVARANGAEDEKKAKNLFSTGLKVNAILGVLLFGILLLVAQGFEWFNQDPEVIEVCLDYYLIISVSIFPLMLFQGFKQYVEALQDTLTPMYISILCNVFNIGLNYLLIFGEWGFPELGIVGAGISTLISRVLMLLIFVGYFYWELERRKLLIQVFKTKFSRLYAKEILGIGLPISVYMFFEVTAFSAATFMVGWISKDHLSGHQIALSLASMSFVVSMGVGNAGSIRSATYLGKKQKKKISSVAIATVLITLVLSLIAALFFLLFKDDLPLIFVPSTETVIIAQASSMLILAAIFQFSDGLQVVFQGLLQGIGDVKVPSVIAIFSYWAIGLPLGYWFAFMQDFSAQGIWIGLAIGLTFSAILQALRYRYSLKRLKLP